MIFSLTGGTQAGGFLKAELFIHSLPLACVAKGENSVHSSVAVQAMEERLKSSQLAWEKVEAGAHWRPTKSLAANTSFMPLLDH